MQLWCIFQDELQSTGQCGLLAPFPLSTLCTLSHYPFHSQPLLFDAFFIRAMITAIIATAVVINQLQSQYKTSYVWLDARQLSLSSTLPLLIFKWWSSGGDPQKRISAPWCWRAQLRGQGYEGGLRGSSPVLMYLFFQWSDTLPWLWLLLIFLVRMWSVYCWPWTHKQHRLIKTCKWHTVLACGLVQP